MPSAQYSPKARVHVISKVIEYGNINEVTVPIPVFFTQRWQKATTSGKYGIRGVTIFVVESPTR